MKQFHALARLASKVLFLLLILQGCGRVGEPIPPGHAMMASPGGLTITGVGEALNLSWSEPTTTVKGVKTLPPSAYLIERSVWPPDVDACLTCPEENEPIETLDADLLRSRGLPANIFIDTDIKPGWTYRYRVIPRDHRERVGMASIYALITWESVEKPKVKVRPKDRGALISYSPPKTIPEGVTELGLALYNDEGELVMQIPPASGTAPLGGLENDLPTPLQGRWVVATPEGWQLQSAAVNFIVTPRDSTPPPPPEEIVAFTQDSGIVLNWLPARGEGYVNLIIERATDGGQFTPLVNLSAGELRYEDQGCKPGKLCRYRLYVVDRVGNRSAPTPVVEVKRMRKR